MAFEGDLGPETTVARYMDEWILNCLKKYNERTMKSPAHIVFAFHFSLTFEIMVDVTAAAAAAAAAAAHILPRA